MRKALASATCRRRANQMNEVAMKTKTLTDAVLLLVLTLPLTMPVHAQQPSAPGLRDRIKGMFSGPNSSASSSAKEDELIEPDLAFRLKVTARSANMLHVDLVPANGYYIYKERIRFALKDGSAARISNVKFPAGEMKTDQIDGRTEVFKKPVPITITLDNAAKGKTVTLMASYQGCHEKLGVCYPPIDKAVDVVLP